MNPTRSTQAGQFGVTVSAAGAEEVARGHEFRDVRIRSFVWFATCFVVAIAVIHLVVWFGMREMEDRATERDAARSGPSIWKARPLAAEPRLQPSRGHESTDWSDLQALKAAQYNSLERAGFAVDRRTGASEIPQDALRRVGATIAASTQASPSTHSGGGMP